MKVKKQHLYLVIIVLFIFSLAPHIKSVDYWTIDIFSHFPVQYALIAVLLLILCLWKRYVVPACLAAVLFLFNISAIVDYGSIASASLDQKNTFTVTSANINKSNNDLSNVVARLWAADPDILLLLEVTGENITSLQPLVQGYPHRIVNLNIGSSGTGTVLVSKFPILDPHVIKYSEFGNMLVATTMKIHNKTISFYGVHFPKPMNVNEFPERTNQIVSLAGDIRKQKRPVIIAGDFNTTPYSPIFKKLLHDSRLKDTRDGFGWLPSWPAYLPPMWIPIDHILVSQDIAVLTRETGPYIGSDHYPVIAELSLSNLENTEARIQKLE
jgi:endonuclease/exonuclease/phosphatase (EEP) superfamily protein YafD